MRKICDQLAEKQFFYFVSINEEFSFHNKKNEYRIEGNLLGERITFYSTETSKRGALVVVEFATAYWVTQAWTYSADGTPTLVEMSQAYKEDDDQRFVTPLIDRMIEYLDSPTGGYPAWR